MKKLFKSISCAYKLWEMGYYLSDNTDKESDGCSWGFIRLNFDNGEQKKFAIVDWDFRKDNVEKFSHDFISMGNGDSTLHRWDEVK